MTEAPLVLTLRSDYPAKTSSLKISPSATFAQFRKESSSSLGVSLADYDVRAISFAQDAKLLPSDAKLGDKQTLADAGIVNKSVLYFSAPMSSRPASSLPRVKVKFGAGDEKATDRTKDRYRGLTSKNILRKLASGLRPKEEKIAMEFVEINALAVLKQPDFTKLPRRWAKMIVESPGLNASEIDVFDAVVNWGTADCKALGREPTGENLRKSLGDLLQCIRFPLMTMTDVATKLIPANILTPEQTVLLYTYLGSSEDVRKSMIIPFTEDKRVPRRHNNFWCWDPEKKANNIQLLENNMVAANNDVTSNNWNSVFGDMEVSEGIAEWEIVLTQYNTDNSYNVVIGCVPSTFTTWGLTTFIGYYQPGWSFVTGNGNKAHNGDPQHYGSACTQGDVLRVRVDLNAHTMEIIRNGVSMGTMFADVTGTIRPAISLVNTQRVTLRMVAVSSSNSGSGS